jgi:hypothetical protein
MTPSAKQESYWLSSPLVASGTVKSGFAGCFRAADVTEVVLDQHNELQLLSTNSAGKLEPIFKQPLFCRIRQMCVLRFSLAQPDNTQLQVGAATLWPYACMLCGQSFVPPAGTNTFPSSLQKAQLHYSLILDTDPRFV